MVVMFGFCFVVIQLYDHFGGHSLLVVLLNGIALYTSVSNVLKHLSVPVTFPNKTTKYTFSLCVP